ncbi:MAG: DUF4011 domain-containing protein [Lentisphaeria bacterium]|jgi:very-short-patch-repair endonuclease
MPDNQKNAAELCPLGLEVEIAATSCINFAMQQNDVPILREVRIKNVGDRAFAGLALRVTTDPPVTSVAERPLSPLAPGDDISVRDLHPRLLREILAAQTERELGELRVELLENGVLTFRQVQRLEVLAANEWSGAFAFPELLASFILPNQPAIAPVLAKARDLLFERTGKTSISGYQNHDSSQILAEAAAIYGAIAKSGITYSNPPASFERTGQKIRLPDQMFDYRLGTCLDLAVLYAGSLELAGLHPLVILIQGHAFVAVWLKDTTFKQAVTEDAAALRKRIDLGEMVAVEVVGAAQTPPVPFQPAVGMGRARLADCVTGGTSVFQYALDVSMARKEGIRPLAFRGDRIQLDNDLAVEMPAAPTNLTAVAAPVVPLLSIPSAPPADKGPQRLERWKLRLLDLTRRNRLLNFKENKKSLRLLCPDLGDLEDALAVGEAFTILPEPKVMGTGDPRSAVIKFGTDGEDARGRFLHEQLAKHILHSFLTEKELESRLLGIARTARSNLEETGANTLYLTLGFLRWYEKNDPQENLAPILLIPLHIERHSVREGFKVCLLDDEPRINVTLLQKLSVDFGLDILGLDPLPTDHAGLDVAGIFARFRDAVKDMQHWDVAEDVNVCILTFTKFLMWWDLEKNAKALTVTPVARHLIETPTEPFPVPAEPVVPTPEQFDTDLRASALFCPLDADSSQISAIVGAAAGHSFVLEGPPGTGKSQTITNLIVHCLAQRKRVLFVSEKAAALSVVHKRLQASGMAPFCLQLHSTKTTREELRRQLEAALDVAGRQSTADWETEALRLEELRAHLNGYVEALHRPRNIGRSIHWAMDVLIHHRETMVLKLPVEMDELDAVKFEKMREAVSDLKRIAVEVGDPVMHSLREFGVLTWSMTLPSELRQAIDALTMQIPKLERAAAPLMESYRLGTGGWTESAIEFTAELTKALDTAPCITSALLEEPEWRDADFALRKWIGRGRARDAARTKLFDRLRKDILSLEVAPLLAAAGQMPDATILKMLLADNAQPSRTADVIAQCRRLVAHTSALASRVLRVLPDYHLGRANWDFFTLQFAAKLSWLLLTVPDVTAELLSHDRWQANITGLRDWIAKGRTRDVKRRQVLENYSADVFKVDLAELVPALKQRRGSWVLNRWLIARRVRKALCGVRKNAIGSNEWERVCSELVQALETHEETKQLAAAAEPTRIFGAGWMCGEADWDRLSAILDWSDEFHKHLQLVAATDSFTQLCSHWSQLALCSHDLAPEDRAVFCKEFDGILTLRKQLATAVGVSEERIWGADDAEGYLERSTATLQRWTSWLSKLQSWRGFRLEIAPVCDTTEKLSAELEQIRSVQEANAELASAPVPNRFFGNTWNLGDAQWDSLETILDWLGKFRILIQKNGDTAHREFWMGLALAANTPGTAVSTRFLTEHRAFCELRGALAQSSRADMKTFLGQDNAENGNFLAGCVAKLDRWRNGLPGLRVWCQYRNACEQAAGLKLGPVVNGLMDGTIHASSLEDLFDASFVTGWLNWMLPQEPRLNQFFGKQHHDRIERFRQIDAGVRDITREVVVARLAALIPQGTDKAERVRSSELGKISRFVRSKGRASIRSVFAECPDALSRLKPCMLMSPLSVAQFLSSDFPPFDLVVFDEASQMPAWDAIGAIARGKQLVVVGDTKQLPPTNFFEKKENADATGADLDDDVVDEVESILDECKSTFPRKMLNWHYRSRHESLIAFSNRRYYDNGLLTFPSPDMDTHELGVSWREAVGGCYDAGKTRTNRAEADLVVAEVVRRLKDPALSHQSIGIVTFSITQQALIEDLLEKARRENPEIDPFFDPEQTEESVFVKNLETVQGDERDVILFSICYGPDLNGRLVMYFGPLSNEGGERRLNVAVTRARRQLVVFSTLRPEQINLSRTKALGVSHLREFLEFARRGNDGVSVGGQSIVQNAEDAKPTALEREVVAALVKNEWKVDRQIGCSDYRIDLAVRHPQVVGKFLLGIEFDGANYKSAKTARDRDRLRSDVLTSLGWKLHRIWSAEWWQNPTGEIVRLERALKSAMEVPVPTAAVQKEPATLSAAVATASMEAEDASAPVVPTNLNGVPRSLFDVSTEEIAKNMGEVVSKHLSIATEELYKETSLLFGCKRLTNRAKEQLEKALVLLLGDGTCTQQNGTVRIGG